ncbi:MAG: transposase [Desulfobacter sp.]|nr:transposase [Desulfobacter sp.]
MADLNVFIKCGQYDRLEEESDILENKWNDKYPIVIKSRRNNWERLSHFFKYPEEIRRTIYTHKYH